MAGNNDAVNESLSALLDGEHSELDLRRVLKAAASDEAVADKWASYHLVRQVIKKDLELQCNDDFLSGIQQAIAEESAQKGGVKPSVWQRFSGSSSLAGAGGTASHRWQNYGGKLAIAACFTFVFLIGANQWSRDQGDAPTTDLAAENSTSYEPMAVVPHGFELPPLTARTVSSMPSSANSTPYVPLRSQRLGQSRLQEVILTAEQQALLQRLMLKHADASAANGSFGVMPYTRVSTGDVAE